MKRFSCSRCGHSTSTRADLNKHLNKKVLCEPIIEDSEPELVDNGKSTDKCNYCDKIFSSTSTLNRHIKTCKNKLQQLEDKVVKLEQQLAQQASNTTNIDNRTTNNIQQQNNIIIQITPYNDPNLDGAEKYYLQAIKKLFMSIPTIIERIHFNSELPENHNILITNYRTKMAKAWTGTEWKTMDEDQLITELVNTYENLLEDWADGDSDKMKHIEKYKEIKERDGRIKVEKEIREEVKKLIYDKRGMIRIKT